MELAWRAETGGARCLRSSTHLSAETAGSGAGDAVSVGLSNRMVEPGSSDVVAKSPEENQDRRGKAKKNEVKPTFPSTSE